MVRPLLKFTGLMAPVFTCFKEDSAQTVNISSIDAYARYLESNGVKGVLVNGTTGEGPVMSVTERKQLTEAWNLACKKYHLTLMVQIGGAPLTDVIDLAKHSAELNVDAVLCLPELYFKPKSIPELVSYLKRIAKYCPDIPFLYYHIPMFTGLTLHMPTFCEQAEKDIDNFIGLKYTSGDLDQGADCLKLNRHVFLGADTILSGALVLGFDSAIMTSLNICPQFSIRILENMKNSNLTEAKLAQQQLTGWIKKILKDGGGDWVPSMKKAFNDAATGISIQAGQVRRIS